MGYWGGGPALVSCAILASLVAEPLVVTTARPSPSTTKVPAKASSPASTVTGTLSPVSVEVSMLSVWASTTLRSAEMRSPELRRTTSPTTSSLASISTDFPSRITVALRGSRSRRRSAARSALYSWAKAKRPFITTTAKIATPSSGILAANARIPAPQSRSAKKWTICPARRRHAGGGGVTGKALGLSRSRRAAASVVLSPSRIPEEVAGAGTSPGFIGVPPGCQASRHSLLCD